MKRISKIGLGLLIVVVTSIGGYLLFTNQSDDIDVPTLIPRAGDVAASGEFLNAQKAVEYYRGEIKRRPEVVKNYVELAQLFLQEARNSGLQHEYIQKADWLLQEALLKEPENSEAQITMASLLLTKHQFHEGKQLAEKVILKNAYSAFSYGILCDALVELGQYEQAVTVCEKMQSIRPDLRSYARASYLREVHGDIPGARAAMQLAAESGVSGQENRAWALYNLGKLYLNEGNLDTAEFIFNGILEERENHGHAMSGLAHIEYAKGNTEKAISLLKRAFEVTPEHPFVEQLADLYRSIGDAKNADATIETVFKEFKEHDDMGWNVDKEFALFCANHGIRLSEALSRAKKEYESRPLNIEALDTYGWTLYKVGRAEEAVPHIEQALRLKTRNAPLFFHAGMIYNAVGNTVKAKQYLQEALAINPHMQPLYAADAHRTLESLQHVAMK